MQLAKTVAGVYVLDDEEVVASDRFDADMLPDAVFEPHPLEEEYADAEPVVLDAETLADFAGITVSDLRQWQVQAATLYTRQQLPEEEGRDQLLVQAVRALDDVNEQNNELSERLRPWYSLHFPELEDAIDDNDQFAALVAAHADRDAFEEYDELAADSTGLQITGRDADVLERFAAHLVDGYEMRHELEDYVADVAAAVVPNLSAVLDPLLAARMLSAAGSLEKLAKMPSSTVQVLGAEKAMFRHMKGEGSAPKHGLLFMHSLVQQAPGGEKGKMARVIANKASIAARIDQYDGEFRGDELRAEVEEEFEAVEAG